MAELEWLRVRGTSDLPRIRKFVEAQGCEGYERVRGTDGYITFKLGNQTATGVEWKAAVWLQIWEMADVVEGKIRRALHIE